MNNVQVKDIIQTKIAVSPEKGEILFNYLFKQISNNICVYLSFRGIEDLTTAFLNKAIGNLYNHFSSETLNQCLKITEIDDLDKYLLKKVISRAKLDVKSDSQLSSEIDEVFDNE